ncbi:ribonuclease HII [Actinomycetaceae bacterium L2_0104]
MAGVDEVGRGALAGPVSVGICLIDAETEDVFPAGLRDSKLLSPAKRAILDPLCREWGLDLAVGHAGPDIVDGEGIIVALRRAAAAALAQLAARGRVPDAVLLDGRHNWWAEDSLFDANPILPQLPVRMQVKGDASCAVIAAASVAAKVERDGMMVALDEGYPGYDWASNKGYASARHIDGLRALGPSPLHRRSWHLPGVEEDIR